jgi:hypothetical protein
MTTVYEVEQLMRDKSISDEPKAKIKELFKEILGVYDHYMRQKVEGACDICGKGDSNKYFRLKGVVSGFEKRPEESPRLCYNHFCGWNLSYLARDRDVRFERCPRDEWDKLARFAYEDEMRAKYGMTNEEVDLHFASYLTKQLMKEARKQKMMEEA